MAYFSHDGKYRLTVFTTSYKPDYTIPYSPALKLANDDVVALAEEPEVWYIRIANIDTGDVICCFDLYKGIIYCPCLFKSLPFSIRKIYRCIDKNILQLDIEEFAFGNSAAIK